MESVDPQQPDPGGYFGVTDSAVTDADGEFEVKVVASVDCTLQTDGAADRIPELPAANTTTSWEPSSIAVAEPFILRRALRSIVCTIVDKSTLAPAAAAKVHVDGQTFLAHAKGRRLAAIRRSVPIDVEAEGYALP